MTTKMNEQIEAGDIPRVHNWDEVYNYLNNNNKNNIAGKKENL